MCFNVLFTSVVLRCVGKQKRSGGIKRRRGKVMQGVPSESCCTDHVLKCGRRPEVPIINCESSTFPSHVELNPTLYLTAPLDDTLRDTISSHNSFYSVRSGSKISGLKNANERKRVYRGKAGA